MRVEGSGVRGVRAALQEYFWSATRVPVLRGRTSVALQGCLLIPVRFLLKDAIVSFYQDYLALLIYYRPARPVIGGGYISEAEGSDRTSCSRRRWMRGRKRLLGNSPPP